MNKKTTSLNITIGHPIYKVDSFLSEIDKLKKEIKENTSLSDQKKTKLLIPILFTYTGESIRKLLLMIKGVTEKTVQDALEYIETYGPFLQKSIIMPSTIDITTLEKCNPENIRKNPEHPLLQQLNHILFNPGAAKKLLSLRETTLLLYNKKLLPHQTDTTIIFSSDYGENCVTITPQSELFLNLLITNQFETIDTLSNLKVPGFEVEKLSKLESNNFSTLYLLVTLSMYLPKLKNNINQAIRFLLDRKPSFSHTKKETQIKLIAMGTGFRLVKPMNASILYQPIDPDLAHEIIQVARKNKRLHELGIYDTGSFSDTIILNKAAFEKIELSDEDKTYLLSPFFAQYEITNFSPEETAKALGISDPLIHSIKEFLKDEGRYLYDHEIHSLELNKISLDPGHYLEIVNYAVEKNRFSPFFKNTEFGLPLIVIYNESNRLEPTWSKEHLQSLIKVTLDYYPRLTKDEQNNFKLSFRSKFKFELNETIHLIDIMQLFHTPDEQLMLLTHPKYKDKSKVHINKLLESSDNPRQTIDLCLDTLKSTKGTPKNQVKVLEKLQDKYPKFPQDKIPIISDTNIISTTYIIDGKNIVLHWKSTKLVGYPTYATKQTISSEELLEPLQPPPYFKDVDIAHPEDENIIAIGYKLRNGILDIHWEKDKTPHKKAFFTPNNSNQKIAITLSFSWAAEDGESIISHKI